MSAVIVREMLQNRFVKKVESAMKKSQHHEVDNDVKKVLAKLRRYGQLASRCFVV